jgi:hypothetical protein
MMRSILAILFCSVWVPHALSEEVWNTHFTKLHCVVLSCAGQFNTYADAPQPGDTMEVDLNSILQKGGVFQFKSLKPRSSQSGPEPCIPYLEPFKITKRLEDPRLKLLTERFVSSKGTDNMVTVVTLDIQNGAHFAPNSIRASILMECQGVVTGVCFLQCQIVE